MELGSNFDLDVTGLTYTKENVKTYLGDRHVVYTDSGRSALRYLLSTIKKGKVLLPAYICKSVIDCFTDDFEIQYYELNEHLQVKLSDLAIKLDDTVVAVYVMQYFGWLQTEQIMDYMKARQQELHYIMIEDTTHCFLTQKDGIGDYQICSLRKWFPIPDGGVLYSGKHSIAEDITAQQKRSGMITEAMVLKNLYIRNKVDCNRIYRQIFQNQEKDLDQQKDIYKISAMSLVLLECLDIERISDRRKENWNYLYSECKKLGIVPLYDGLADDFVPFSFPILVENRDDFRKYFIQNHIYCAVHWPMETDEQIRMESNAKIADHILSLPIDQRYTTQELQYVIDVMKEYG